MPQVSKEYEDWMNRKWRPTVAWTYIVTCVCDFIVFPVLWALYQNYTGMLLTPWDPLTLKGGGLFHVAMGAILGITAWSRGQEKIRGSSMYGHNDYDDYNYRPEPQRRTVTTTQQTTTVTRRKPPEVDLPLL
jgi:hypothetical protein